jgi:hypothetical protein
MDSQRTILMRARSHPWRVWLLTWVTLCVLGLYSLAATHHHETAAEEEACAICHVVGHQPLDLQVPTMAPVAVAFVLLFTLPGWHPPLHLARPVDLPYHSRAPPRGRPA